MRKTEKSLVRNNVLLAPDGDLAKPLSTPIGTPRWYEWLTANESFVFKGDTGHMTARRDTRRGVAYWYAYRRRGGRLFKTYLGKSEELTQERLEYASARLAGQTALTQLSSQTDSADLMSARRNEPGAEGTETNGQSCLPMTQVMPPALPHKIIARPRLTQRINAPVTVICAPSGFGKSTVLNEWRQSCGMPVAWVTVDTDDNHPLRFWSKVVTALQVVNPSLGKSWVSQQSASPTSALSNVVINLTNDILRIPPEPNTSQEIGLVLDNYHHITNTEIHTSLQTWLEHIPQTLKLVVTSNTRLPLALGYLRAKGMVIELGIDDLRFTPEEGIEFLLQHTPGQRLAHSDILTLVKRTEGWVAGLVLATCALAQPGNRSRFIETFTGAHPFLREFFTASVLHRQPSEVQTFLLKTSILKRLSGPLCDAVTGQSGSAEILGRLWGERLFLEQSKEPDWYRYHNLFAEMLRAQLQEQFPGEISRLHRKAAKWYRTQNLPADAIDHLLLARAWEEAATLIENVALDELEQLGEDSRLLRWLRQLPEAIVQQHKTLLVVYVQLTKLVLSPMRTLDNQVMLGLPASREPDTVGEMLDGILKCHRDCRVDLIKAEAEANRVYETAMVRNHLFSILLAGGECANLAFSQGHLRRSEQIACQVLRQAEELRDKLPEPASIAMTALSGVYFERNQLAQAHQFLEHASEIAPEPINANESIVMAILRAKIQSIQGDSDAALATIEAARELSSRCASNIWLDQDLNAYQALFHLRQGDLTAAERNLGEGWEIEKNPFSAFVRASILMEQDRNVAAEEILCHLVNRYPSSFYWVPILRARVNLSVALFNQQKINQARHVMAEAARIAAPEFFVRPFLSSEAPIPLLLSLVLHTEDLNPGTRSFIKGTLTMLGHADATKTASRDEPMRLAIAASISPREQEILQSLSIGLSNLEIAIKYSISASTVKTHLENIFRKLGVNSRIQAIAQAQTLDLM